MGLKKKRQNKKMTQEQLAQLSGVDQKTISDIERGHNSNPSWKKIAALAQALECDPHEIFPVELSTRAAS